jgi:hypothetical protein
MDKMVKEKISSWLSSDENVERDLDENKPTDKESQKGFEDQDKEIVEYLGGLEQKVLEKLLEKNPQIFEGMMNAKKVDDEIEFKKEAKAKTEKDPLVVKEELRPTEPEEVIVYPKLSQSEIERRSDIQNENLKNGYISEVIQRYQESSIDEENKIVDTEILKELISFTIDEIFINRDINPDFCSDLNFKNRIISNLKEKYLEINQDKEESELEEIGKVEDESEENKFELIFNQVIEVYLENNQV